MLVTDPVTIISKLSPINFVSNIDVAVMADFQTKKLRLKFSRKYIFRVGFNILQSRLKKMFFFRSKIFSEIDRFRNLKELIPKMCIMILTSELLRKRSRENEHLQCKMDHFLTEGST